MRDSLKEHIEAKREEFEIYDFGKEESWEAISTKLNVKSTSGRRLTYWKYAVAASLILVTGWTAFYLGHTNASVNSQTSEWVEVENYYRYEINTKLSLVKGKVNDPLLISDLESIDEAFEDLKKDLRDNVDNAEVVEAMMENYRLKLKILEKILKEIDKNEKGKEIPEVRL